MAQVRKVVGVVLLGVAGVVACAHSGTLLRLSDGSSSFTPPEALPQLQQLRQLGTEELLARYPSRVVDRLSYDPMRAERLGLIQRSDRRLDAAELAVLAKQGLVISARPSSRSFALAYLDIYTKDLPVFVSADAILHAWHRAYDELLVEVERAMLKPALAIYLSRLRGGLGRASASTEVRAELDTYLTVAESLLADELLTPRAGGSRSRVDQLFQAVKSSHGRGLLIFGKRATDLSQFKPRGHYEKHAELHPYFRAMMWLGQIDFRWLETQADGSQTLSREQIEASLLVRELMGARDLQLYAAIDQTIGVFVGMRDAMSPPDVDRFLRDLGARRASDLGRVKDQTLIEVIRRGGYGRKRIQGDLAAKVPGVGELPLNASFAIFPRRYTLDSHALHSVTEDRVPGRQLPTALDVGFAILGNDFAGLLLKPELERHGYAGQLGAMRGLADAQKEEYWQSSFYSLWIAALRSLSKTEDASGALPSSARTSAWARRILSAQLASWSELRHDTILYAQQSYSVDILCEFPDAYVEPYPELFARLGQTSELGLRVLEGLKAAAAGFVSERTFEAPAHYFERAKQTYASLERIARRERRGERLTASDLEFVNQMIDSRSVGQGCGSRTVYDGWYKDLFYTADILDPDLSIADVHTSEDGIVHVAKGMPRKLVVTIGDRSGARAFAGAAFAYHELTSAERLGDSQWRELAAQEPDEPWLTPIVAHSRSESSARGQPESADGHELEPLPGGGVEEICRIDPGACNRR
jgi:hypothetical protein